MMRRARWKDDIGSQAGGIRIFRSTLPSAAKSSWLKNGVGFFYAAYAACLRDASAVNTKENRRWTS